MERMEQPVATATQEKNTSTMSRKAVRNVLLSTFTEAVSLGAADSVREDSHYMPSYFIQKDIKDRVKTLRKGLIGRRSIIKKLSTRHAIDTAQMDARLAKLFGLATPGAVISQPDFFGHEGETEQEKEKRHTKTTDDWMSYISKYPASFEMGRLCMQMSTWFDRENMRYVMMVTQARMGQIDTGAYTFGRALTVDRSLVYAAIFHNPLDLFEPGSVEIFPQHTYFDRRHPEGKDAHGVYYHMGQPDLENAFVSAMGYDPKVMDVSTLGENSNWQYMNHIAFLMPSERRYI